jgi:hypothetical protein
MKSQSYMTRAMRAHDPRFASILGKLGYDRGDMAAETSKEARTASPAKAPVSTADALTSLRKDYQAVVGKKPFNGWDAETLSIKIAEAKAAAR